jgi:23S rRNA (cytosine1962-C5)-methyltransferase
MYSRIILKQGKEKSLIRRHPWVFSGAISKADGEIHEGDIVEIYDFEGNYLATGHYQPSSISVRIFSFKKIDVSRQFWESKFKDAFLLRKQTGVLNNSNAFRLINAEGDGMPGLIVDYYNGIFVIAAHSAGMYFNSCLFSEILHSLFKEGSSFLKTCFPDGRNIIFFKAVYNKSSETLPFKAGIESKNGFVQVPGEIKNSHASGADKDGKTNEAGFNYADDINPQIIIEEYGYKFIVDIKNGQKTGFFIDQRENRKLLGSFCRNKKVLNAFSYTGGFSVYALGGNASIVHSVDSSAASIKLAEKNTSLNFTGEKLQRQHQLFCEDVFKFLASSDEQYDIIILDPPAFVKHIDSLKQGLRGYERLNEMALKRLTSGGCLFTFSCSQAVSGDAFRTSVFRGALAAKRDVKIIYQLGQPCDHPVNLYHPEGEYLKGLVLQAV